MLGQVPRIRFKHVCVPVRLLLFFVVSWATIKITFEFFLNAIPHMEWIDEIYSPIAMEWQARLLVNARP